MAISSHARIVKEIMSSNWVGVLCGRQRVNRGHRQHTRQSRATGGEQPGTRRGIERRSVYQNTVLLDPMIMQSFANPVNSRSGSSLTEDEKKALEEVLEIKPTGA
ncbi:hypothetical protein [Paenibacillus sp. Leaf72]|uniref:hypothetical protein n=1 Tax=Paenibacillus sp. Leaf72 TaxID=1736234 RepID=UPI001F296C0E|nr:hypothetical protein [Paenibacillus sp. Leaf72]